MGIIAHLLNNKKMRLYKTILPTHGGIKRNETKEGLPPERMFEMMKDNASTGGLQGKEAIYPMEGIPYNTDIRSNKWDKAIGETDKISKAIAADRDRKKKRAEERRAEQLEKQAKDRADKLLENSKKEGGTATPE